VRVAAALPRAELPPQEAVEAEDCGARDAFFDGAQQSMKVVRGVPADLPGPAVVELPEATVVVPPGWTACATEGGLRMERV